MKALILIGGLGTRLRPLTSTIPKPLIPLANKPFLYYQFQTLKKYGIKDIILCVSYLPGAFKRIFGNGKKLGIKITYVHEKHPLGTGGAIKNAEKYIDRPVMVLNGDILTSLPIDKLKNYHQARRSGVTIALTSVKDPTAYGLIPIDKAGKIIQFIEKPAWDEVTCNTINSGTYIFQPEVLRFIPRGIPCSLEREVFPLLLKNKFPMYGFVYDGYWLDFGTTEAYLKAHADILREKMPAAVEGRQIKKNLWAGRQTVINSSAQLINEIICSDHTRIGDQVKIIGPVSIGKKCRIKRNAVLNQCVILDSCVIGEGSKLTRCIVGNNCIIEPYSVISSGVVLGHKSIIKKYSKL
ncbi:MAG: NDP-sugar synthase [bacterium]